MVHTLPTAGVLWACGTEHQEVPSYWELLGFAVRYGVNKDSAQNVSSGRIKSVNHNKVLP